MSFSEGSAYIFAERCAHYDLHEFVPLSSTVTDTCTRQLSSLQAWAH